MSYRFADNLKQNQDVIPDDRQRNCPRHVEFYSKNKFVNLVHLVGFIIRIYHGARSPELQNESVFLYMLVTIAFRQFFTKQNRKPYL